MVINEKKKLTVVTDVDCKFVNEVESSLHPSKEKWVE